MQTKPKKISYLSKRNSYRTTRKPMKKVRLISQSQSQAKKNRVLSAIALVPQAVVMIIVFLAIYLKLKRPVFNKAWIDVLLILSLIPISYAVNLAAMIAFQSPVFSNSSSSLTSLTLDDGTTVDAAGTISIQ